MTVVIDSNIFRLIQTAVDATTVIIDNATIKGNSQRQRPNTTGKIPAEKPIPAMVKKSWKKQVNGTDNIRSYGACSGSTENSTVLPIS